MNPYLARLRNAHAPYRTRVAPHGTVLGRVGPTVPSGSVVVFGAQGETPAGGSPTHWTPWGLQQAGRMPLRRLRNLGPATIARSPGAYFTPPALFQLPGIPVPQSLFASANGLTSRPFAGRTATPPVRHVAINPFPGSRLPLPTNPAPAAFRGVL